MATHKAHILSSFDKPLTLTTVPTPTPQLGQVLVRVLSTPLLSYSALVLNNTLAFPLSLPLTPGPSAIARITALSNDSPNLRVGQLVFCTPIVRARDDPSGLTCILQGWNGGVSEQSMKLMAGAWRDGAWAEMMVVPTENVVVLDEAKLVGGLGYSFTQLTWINELAIAYGPLEASGLSLGESVIVAPATGHFGGSVVRLALALGASTVVAAARGKDKLDALAKVCPQGGRGRLQTVVLSGDAEADGKALREKTPRGEGADVYVDFSPFQAAGSTHPKACVAALKSGGRAVLSGGVREDLGGLNYAQLMMNNLTVRGNFMYGAGVPGKIAKLLEGGLVSLDGFDVTAFEFERVKEGIDAAPKIEGFANMAVLTPTE